MHEGRAKACKGVKFDIFSKKEVKMTENWYFLNLFMKKSIFFTESKLAQKV